MPRLAWFSPMPPERTGVAVASADILPALRAGHDIDVFVAVPPREAPVGLSARPAHDFIWAHQRCPYDLCVYQLGNSASHDFIWPYLFRYPGLAVLHDGHLHHARAANLLREKRRADYRAEFVAAEPLASPDVAELAIAGFDTYLYYGWPMTRLVAQASRVTAVHSRLVAEQLAETAPGSPVEYIRLAHGRPMDDEAAARARADVRQRHGIPGDALVFGVFGGLAPEKRIPQVLDAFRVVQALHPDARLLLVGAAADHYDLAANIAARGAAGVIVTGWVTDEELDAHIAAVDVSINLRWPSARETSGPWLRAIAAARPTITTDLWHTADVPSLDPRTWRVNHLAARDSEAPDPVTIAIDILDEAHSLGLAMRRLAVDEGLRARLGGAAKAHWIREHDHDGMVNDYRRAITRAIAAPEPHHPLPPHLRTHGDEQLANLLRPFGLPQNPWSRI